MHENVRSEQWTVAFAEWKSTSNTLVDMIQVAPYARQPPPLAQTNMSCLSCSTLSASDHDHSISAGHWQRRWSWQLAALHLHNSTQFIFVPVHRSRGTAAVVKMSATSFGDEVDCVGDAQFASCQHTIASYQAIGTNDGVVASSSRRDILHCHVNQRVQQTGCPSNVFLAHHAAHALHNVMAGWIWWSLFSDTNT